MKLLLKTSSYYLIFLIILAPVMIIVDYYLIHYLINKEVNTILVHEGERIQYYLSQQDEIPSSVYWHSKNLRKDTAAYPLRSFRDTLINEAYFGRIIPYRIYEFSASGENEQYNIVLRYRLLEMNELIRWLFAATTLIIILLAVGLFIINDKISRWVWKPFYQNLAELKNYDISRKNTVRLEDAGIKEFEALNQVITTLMTQVEKDFQQLKEFNENISHEMQTPLTVIRNKMVLLLESQHLNPKELRWVESAYQEVNKLSKIGKSLTLISRIENQEFTRMERVDLRSTLENIVGNLEEIINFKKIRLTLHLDYVELRCDPILSNILFTNLIKNAIQHNVDGGYIRMMLSKDRFIIENSGEALKVKTEKLFNRFQKGGTTADNLGLGLAISKRIAELYGFRLNYDEKANEHRFVLLFNELSN
jgi:signal transduction histidine kinase